MYLQLEPVGRLQKGSHQLAGAESSRDSTFGSHQLESVFVQLIRGASEWQARPWERCRSPGLDVASKTSPSSNRRMSLQNCFSIQRWLREKFCNS